MCFTSLLWNLGSKRTLWEYEVHAVYCVRSNKSSLSLSLKSHVFCQHPCGRLTYLLMTRVRSRMLYGSWENLPPNLTDIHYADTAYPAFKDRSSVHRGAHSALTQTTMERERSVLFHPLVSSFIATIPQNLSRVENADTSQLP